MKHITNNNSCLERVDVKTYEGKLREAVDDLIDSCGQECQEDAFYACDLGDVLRKYQRWQRQLPRVAPHYAVKCNDDPVLLALMAGIGMGFDCASKNEIKKILDQGVDAGKIIYANPCKQSNHIKFAINNGVSLMTFDNLDELDKVKAICPEAKLVLRILPKESKAVCNLGIKYGAPQKDVPALLARARELRLNIVGVSFHVGSGCQEAAAFPAAVQLARATFDKAIEFGFSPYLLDIGGGFPGDDSADISFEEICEDLRPALEEFFPESGGVQVIAEPGRYFVASAYTLAVNVIAKRRPSQEIYQQEDENDEKPLSDGSKFMYYVNDGVYGSFNCLLYDHAVVHPVVPKADSKAPRHVSSVWGPTCDGLDCLNTGVLLPELEVGDWLLYSNMGAYTLSAGSTFNGMPRPRGHYLIGLDEVCAEDYESCAMVYKLLMPPPPPLLDPPSFLISC